MKGGGFETVQLSRVEGGGFGFVRCQTLEEVFEECSRHGARARLVCGATDLGVWLQARRLEPCVFLDLSRVEGLRGIREEGSRIVIGATTTYTDMLGCELLHEEAPVLIQACRVVGSVQIRNRGTIGGNLANASPAADLVPPLFVLDATIRIASLGGYREVPVDEFATGPGRTVLRPGEVVTEIAFAKRHVGDADRFFKLGPRVAQAISVVSIALRARRADGARRFERVRIAYGSVAPTVVRAEAAEAALTGVDLDPATVAAAAARVLESVRPIDDVRASAAYRRDQSVVLLEAIVRSVVDGE